MYYFTLTSGELKTNISDERFLIISAEETRRTSVSYSSNLQRKKFGFQDPGDTLHQLMSVLRGGLVSALIFLQVSAVHL